MTLQPNQPERKRDPLPNLHRFAVPGPTGNSGSNEATTIYGKVIDAAHQEFDRSAAERPPVASARRKLEAMLGVVSYCYTKGVYSSVDIEERLWHDPAFLAAFGSETPTAQKIRAFRREHGENLLATIEHALQDFCRPDPAHPDSPHKTICQAAGSRDWARRKASELLAMARFTDAMDSD